MPIRTRLAPYYGRCNQLIECAATAVTDPGVVIGVRASILYGLVKVIFSKAESIRTTFKSTLKSLVHKWVGSMPVVKDDFGRPPSRKRRRNTSDSIMTSSEDSNQSNQSNWEHSQEAISGTSLIPPSPQPHAMNQLIRLPTENFRKALVPRCTSPNTTGRYQNEVEVFELPWTPRKPVETDKPEALLETPPPPGSMDFLHEPNRSQECEDSPSPPSPFAQSKYSKSHDSDAGGGFHDNVNLPQGQPDSETRISSPSVPNMTQKDRITKFPKLDKVTTKFFNSHELQIHLRARSRRRLHKRSVSDLLMLPESITRLQIARRNEISGIGIEQEGMNGDVAMLDFQEIHDAPYSREDPEGSSRLKMDGDTSIVYPQSEAMVNDRNSDPLASLIAANGGVLPPAEPQTRGISLPDLSDDSFFGNNQPEVRRNEEIPVLSDISMELSSLPEINSPVGTRPQNHNPFLRDELLDFKELEIEENTSYSELQKNYTDRSKADILYGLLVRASRGSIILEQEHPFEELRIQKVTF